MFYLTLAKLSWQIRKGTESDLLDLKFWFWRVEKLKAEMEKRADSADISVLFFFLSCANFLAVYAQTSQNPCAISTVLKAICKRLCSTSTLRAIC